MMFQRLLQKYWAEAQMRKYLEDAPDELRPYVYVWQGFQAVRLRGPEWIKA